MVIKSPNWRNIPRVASSKVGLREGRALVTR